VLELGPGSGRYTRHLLPRCREMILVDYSRFVCEWIARYLAGKGRFRVHLIDKPLLAPVAAERVDVVVAHGVFEHIDPDETFCFLEEFRRVLRPGGVAAFDFENFMSEGGRAWFLRWKPPPGLRSPFRFYHPEMLAGMARAAGLEVLRVSTSRDRIGYIELRKPGAGLAGR
jgi:SAM-dependent methyltransferase